MGPKVIRLANCVLEILRTVASEGDSSSREEIRSVLKHILADASLASELRSLTPIEEEDVYLLLRRESEARRAPQS